MRQDGNTKVKEFFASPAPGGYAYAIEFGAQGNAICLLGVNLMTNIYTNAAYNYFANGLSSNPSHVDNPPGSLALWMQDKAIYARQTHWVARGSLDENWGVFIYNQYLSLFFLPRPTRQLVVGFNGQSGSMNLCIEYYYHDLELSRKEKDDLNLVYGKYRRNR